MITYGIPTGTTSNKTVAWVKLEGKLIGHIERVDGGFQYFPKGHKTGGKVFDTIAKVKHSLEYDDDEQGDI